MPYETIDEIRDDLARHIGLVPEEPDYKADWSKLEGARPNGYIAPGSRLVIWWDYGKSFFADKGYLLTLPGPDSHDVYMTGIVHIPNPQLDREPEEVWIHLAELLSIDEVTKVEVQQPTKSRLMEEQERDDIFEATWGSARIQLTPDWGDNGEWFIFVEDDGEWLYNAQWDDSSDKTVSEAFAEAVEGVLI